MNYEDYEKVLSGEANYSDIYRKAERMRKSSRVSKEETEQVLSAYLNASIANRDLSISNRREIVERANMRLQADAMPSGGSLLQRILRALRR